MGRIIGIAAVVVVIVAPQAAEAEVLSAGPAEDWCGVINGAAAGDEVHLAAGTYTTPCSIRASGAAGSPVTVRSEALDAGSRAVLAYAGSSSNVVDLREVSHLVLLGLDFQDSADDVDAVKIHGSTDVTIEDCTFTNIGGISVSAVDGSSARMTVRGCRFESLRATGMYFGCYEGEACQATDLLIEGNLIDGVTPREGSVGYGMQIKVNSWGVVRDNTIYDTAGPGIMVYGSNRGDPPSIVEGNYVEGARNESGITLGGGPVIVRNNVCVGNHYGGIYAQDYAGRGLQQGVWIVHNTLLASSQAGVTVQAWEAGAGNVIAFNAFLVEGGIPTLQPASPSGEVVGNVT